MGSVLCCAGSAACCACQSLTTCCFSTAGAAGGRAAKAAYLVLVVVSAILALVLRYYGDSIAPYLAKLPTGDLATHITQDAAVYRISLVMCIFFVAMMVMTLIAPKFHRGCWGIKLLLYVLAMGGSVFIPNSVFDNNGYAWFARVASVLFLVLQIISMIDFAYNWNDNWVKKANDAADNGGSGKGWLAAILACASVIFAVCLVGVGLLFAFLSTDGVSTFFTCATLVGIIGFTALQLFGPDSDGSLLSSALVALYCVYLDWSAINSNPNEPRVNFSGGGSGSDAATMVLGMAVAALSLAWTCYSGSLSFESIFTSGKASLTEEEREEKADLRDPMLQHDGQKATDKDAGGQGKGGSAAKGGELRHSHDEAEDIEVGASAPTDHTAAAGEAQEDRGNLEKKERYWIFHMFLATGSVYMAMLFTDWGSGDSLSGSGGGSAAGPDINIGRSSMWIKICSQWLTMALYTWTLTAAYCCPNRSFD